MYNKIIFFNHFHNGDLHVSREIVKNIIKKVKSQNPKISFYYSHNNSPNLLSDIDDLSFSTAISQIKNTHANLVQIGDAVFINTWYGQQDYKFMNRYGLTIDCLYAALDDSCRKIWNFSLQDISPDFFTFFPTIDYSKFEINNSKIWLDNHPEKKIFIANGLALSGQATNFNITEITVKLAKNYPNITFILTNYEDNRELPNNVVYSSSIIKKSSLSDLNENSFISSYCDMIIGRSSGASTFAITQENLFKRPTKIIYFTNIVPVPPNQLWTGELLKDKITYSADIICTNESNPDIVYDIINSKI